jgi:putative transposase
MTFSLILRRRESAAEVKRVRAATIRPTAARTLEDQSLALEVAAIHAESRGRYGSPRVHAELRARGRRNGRKRVARLMRVAGLRARARRRCRCTTDSAHAMAIRDNLLARRFATQGPNLSWVTDITYLWTPEGWLYLAVVLDLFSRRVVGWAMRPGRSHGPLLKTP